MQKIILLLTLCCALFGQLQAQTSLRVETNGTAQCNGKTEINITVNEYLDLYGAQFSINWDATVFNYSAITYTNPLLENDPAFGTPSSNNAIEEGNLLFSWAYGNINNNPQGVTIPPNEVLFTLQLCNVGATGNSPSAITISDDPLFREATKNDFSVESILVQNASLAVADNTDPTISCPANQTIVIPANQTMGTASGTTPTVNDNCGVASVSYTLSGATNQSTVVANSADGETLNRGVTTITYTVTDNAGNTNTCFLDVMVGDAAPVQLVVDAGTATCGDEDYRVDIDVRDFEDMVGLQFSVNWDPTMLSFQGTDNLIFTSNANFNNNANEQQNGILTFSWFDNTTTEGIDYQDNTRIFTIIFDVLGDAGDNANIDITDNSLAIESTAIVEGEATVIPTTTADASVTVIDNENPQIFNCPNNISVAANSTGSGSSACGAVVFYNEPIAQDNCSLASFSGSANSGDFFPVGQTTVTYTAEDNAGNTAQCNFQVNVSDSQGPVANCQDITVNIGATGDITITPDDIDNGSTDNCGIVSRTVSPDRFDCSDRGVNMVTLTVTDASGNVNTCTAQVTVNDAASNCEQVNMSMPLAGNQNTLNQLFGVTPLDAEIQDPCTCRNNVAPLVNGEVSTTGLFDDEIIVISRTAGDVWQITGTSDSRPLPFQTTANPNAQPNNLNRVTVGTTLNSVGAFNSNGTTFYIYSLEVIHQEEEGYSVTVEEQNGRYANSLETENTCFYSEPFIDNIFAAYTTDCSNPVTIVGTEPNGVAGNDFTFTLNGPDASLPITVTDPNAPEITFDPSSLNMGDYTATFRFDGGTADDENITDPGCEVTVVANFSVVAPPQNLVCNNNVVVSLNRSCESIITPDNVLEGDQIDYDLFSVEVLDQFGNSRGNTVTMEDEGKTLMVRIRDNCSGNTCMGSVTVQDKFPPQFICPEPITVACTMDLDSIPAPAVEDNCDLETTAVLIDETYEDLGCTGANNIVARVTRTYIARDENGNTSNTCTQVINIEKFTLADVVFPLDRNGMAGQLPVLECTGNSIDTEPSATGFPTINGGAIDGDDVCKIVASYRDERIENCGGTFDVIRTWSVYDWCEPLVNGTNPRTDVQVIKVMDNTAPVITCQPSITVSANNNDCTASTTLPAATITDACSTFEVRVSTPRGVIEGNGGQINNLQLGNNIVTYRATDECGNVSTCEMQVTVTDNIDPVANLIERTVTTLNNAGMAQVCASNLNNGSYDNCSNFLTYGVRRANTEDEFLECIVFSCTDANTTVPVIVRVRDAVGNENFGMVQVEVQDESAPIIQGPPSPITLDCTQDPLDLDITGRATIQESCGAATISFQDTNSSLSNCGEGTITRVFTAINGSGMTATYTQTININNTTAPITINDIVFPRDTIFNNVCAPAVTPDDLPEGYNRPVITADLCTGDQIVMSFRDERFDVIEQNENACYKIIRTWSIIDWCQYQNGQNNNQGRFENVQVIKVADTVAPVITCPDNLTLNVNANCESGAFTIPRPTIVDCADDLEIIQSGDLGNAAEQNNVGLGTYTVNFSVTDDCGNAAGCAMTINVVDNTIPELNCFATMDIALTDELATVSAEQFVNMMSDNCSTNENLIVAFSQDPTDLTRQFDCDDFGNNSLEIYARDEAGNWTLACPININITDPTGSCSGGLIAAVGGQIMTEDGTEVEQTMVYVNGGSSDSMNTTVMGAFMFENLEQGGDYTIIPSRDDNHVNGVTTFDLVLLLKHILGAKKLDSPYQIIAGDVNRSGSLTTLDLINIRRLLLQYDLRFENNTSWRFIPVDYEFVDPANPFVEHFPEVLNFNNLSTDDLNANFVAVKVGDLNGSAIPNELLGTEERSITGALILQTEEQNFNAGEEIEVPIYAKDFNDIMGMQMVLSFATELMELTDIIPASDLSMDNFGTVGIGEGLLHFSWNDAKAIDRPEEEALFTLIFQVYGNGALSEMLSVKETTGLRAEAYQGDVANVTTLNVNLQVGTMVDEEGVILLQNMPNPFRNSTIIGFSLPSATHASLRVFDMAGRTLRQISADYEKGYHEIELSDLKGKGILYYQLDTPTFTATKKMILLD